MVKNFKRGRRATLNLARHLAVQGPARREAEKSVEDNLAPTNLQLRRPPVQVRAKREADERKGRTSMVDLMASQRVERKLRLSAFRDNRSVGRKRERRLQRRGHNYLVNFSGGSRAKSSGAACLDKQVSCSGSCVSRNFSYVCRATRLPLQQFGDLHGVQGRAFQQLIA